MSLAGNAWCCRVAILLATLTAQLAIHSQAIARQADPLTDLAAAAEAFRLRAEYLPRFDTNGNGRLEPDERRNALAWIAGQPPSPLLAPGTILGTAIANARPRFAPTSPGIRISPADVQGVQDASLYDAATLRTFFLDFDTDDWERELVAFNNSDVDVPATVTVDGVVHPDVGVRFRGMSSFFMIPDGSKRSLRLAFDFVHPDQNLLGYRTLNLLNAFGDATLVRGALYSHIASHYLPTPKYNFARVVINGEYWGVYASAQQFNSEFVREHFPRGGGVRWRIPGFPGAQGGMVYLDDDPDSYRRFYELRSRESPQAWADLIHLFRVLHETPLDRLEAELEPLLNIEGVLRFLALDIALANSDGYWVRGSDYSIYQDRDGRFHVLPHDMNEGLFAEPASRIELDPLRGLDNPAQPLRSRLLSVPALQERYLAHVREIADHWLDWAVLEPLVAEYHALIRNDVRLDSRKLRTYEEFEAGVVDSGDSIRRFADQRRAFLLEWRKQAPALR
jgi:hypothetical protein